MALLAEDGRFGLQAAERITEIEAAGEAALDALGARKRAGWIKSPWVTRALLFWGVRPSTHAEGLGHIPVASLASGTLCLLASVILFAGASQRHDVWISCTVIAVTMFAFSIFPTTGIRGRRHAALYDRADEMLQDCPPVEPPVYRPPKEDPGM
ncbi:hypothetical protein BJV74DRAFT_601256 [Russula compacta]|nr:hypothetical protein BJV74DRAFT_601256 [Russula compacta]